MLGHFTEFHNSTEAISGREQSVKQAFHNPIHSYICVYAPTDMHT